MTHLRHDEDLRTELTERHSDDLLFADDHDNAILGVVARCNEEPFVVYSRNKLIDNLVESGMSPESASEFLDFNWNGWLGGSTPGILEEIE